MRGKLFDSTPKGTLQFGHITSLQQGTDCWVHQTTSVLKKDVRLGSSEACSRDSGMQGVDSKIKETSSLSVVKIFLDCGIYQLSNKWRTFQNFLNFLKSFWIPVPVELYPFASNPKYPQQVPPQDCAMYSGRAQCVHGTINHHNILGGQEVWWMAVEGIDRWFANLLKP